MRHDNRRKNMLVEKLQEEILEMENDSKDQEPTTDH